MKIQTTAATGLLLAFLAFTVAACASSGATRVPPTASEPAPSAVTSNGTPPSHPAASASAGPTDAVTETVRDFEFDTPDLTLQSGAALVVTNAGPTVHNLKIRDSSGAVLGGTDDLKAGAAQTITVDVPAGSYTIFCSLPGHESLGIKGTLTVSE